MPTTHPIVDLMNQSVEVNVILQDGKLMPEAVGTTVNRAAYSALALLGYIPAVMCEKPECNCILRLLQQSFPGQRYTSTKAMLTPMISKKGMN